MLALGHANAGQSSCAPSHAVPINKYLGKHTLEAAAGLPSLLQVHFMIGRTPHNLKRLEPQSASKTRVHKQPTQSP